MLEFILNNTVIQTSEPLGGTMLDFVRYHQHLKGTKIGCREGDCGACTVLVGELKDDYVAYRTMTSCLMPLQNARGKHIVTVEGINAPSGLTPIQAAMVEESGTQCGFCTVGFVMSLTSLFAKNTAVSYENAISAIDGNICRCTGYKSIERATARLNALLNERGNTPFIDFAIAQGAVPAYFGEIKKRLEALKKEDTSATKAMPQASYVGGGTDLYVQRAEDMVHATARPLFDEKHLKGITQSGGLVEIASAATVTDLMESHIMQGIFPKLKQHLKLVSSTPIRNMATMAGNLVNASPIGDMTIWLLALDASVVLGFESKTREIPLRSLYLGYKTLAKKPEEIIEKIRFKLPESGFLFNFEKVCKRTYLDIASVNTAISLLVKNGKITEAHLSIGGVGPTPLYLTKTSAWLVGKSFPTSEIDVETLAEETNTVLQSEISPISDVRGTVEYKRLLARQLVFGHFMEMRVGS